MIQARAVASVSPALAYRLLWVVAGLLVIAAGVGRAWDRAWHATRAFDGFWSPPHLFVYLMGGLTTALVVALIRTPRLRRSFGPDVRLPGLPLALPGALALLGGGLAALAFAGVVLDNLWHTTFGLDETLWSAPHAMIGAALAVVAGGFVAARPARRSHAGRADRAGGGLADADDGGRAAAGDRCDRPVSAPADALVGVTIQAEVVAVGEAVAPASSGRLAMRPGGVGRLVVAQRMTLRRTLPRMY